jgi:hypothetical protein
MASITLPPDLEGPLAEEARRLGTTPELLALDSLRRLFAAKSSSDPLPAGRTLFDFLSGYLGRVSGTSEALSEDCGRRFAEGLAEKHRQGHL